MHAADQISRLVISEDSPSFHRIQSRHYVLSFADVFRATVAEDLPRFPRNIQIPYLKGLYIPRELAGLYITQRPVENDIQVNPGHLGVVRDRSHSCDACCAYLPTVTPHYHHMSTFHRTICRSSSDTNSDWCNLLSTEDETVTIFDDHIRPCLTTFPTVYTVRRIGRNMHFRSAVQGLIMMEDGVSRLGPYLAPPPPLKRQGRLFNDAVAPNDCYDDENGGTFSPGCGLYGPNSWKACKTRWYIVYPILDSLLFRLVLTDPDGPEILNGTEFHRGWDMARALVEMPDGRVPTAAFISRMDYHTIAEIILMFLDGKAEVTRPLPAVPRLRDLGYLSSLSKTASLTAEEHTTVGEFTDTTTIQFRWKKKVVSQLPRHCAIP